MGCYSERRLSPTPYEPYASHRQLATFLGFKPESLPSLSSHGRVSFHSPTVTLRHGLFSHLTLVQGALSPQIDPANGPSVTQASFGRSMSLPTPRRLRRTQSAGDSVRLDDSKLHCTSTLSGRLNQLLILQVRDLGNLMPVLISIAYELPGVSESPESLPEEQEGEDDTVFIGDSNVNYIAREFDETTPSSILTVFSRGNACRVVSRTNVSVRTRL